MSHLPEIYIFYLNTSSHFCVLFHASFAVNFFYRSDFIFDDKYYFESNIFKLVANFKSVLLFALCPMKERIVWQMNWDDLKFGSVILRWFEIWFDPHGNIGNNYGNFDQTSTKKPVTYIEEITASQTDSMLLVSSLEDSLSQKKKLAN